MKKASVYLKQRKQFLDKSYSYLVPDKAEIGQRGVFPFGKGNRCIEGIITELSSDISEKELKEVNYLIDKEPLLSKQQLELVSFIKKRNCKSYYNCLKNFTEPIKTYKNNKGKIAAHNPQNDFLVKLKTFKDVRGKIQQEVLNALNATDLRFSDLKKLVPKVTIKTLDRLQELGLISYSKIRESKILNTRESVSKEYLKINDLEYFMKLFKKLLENSKGQTLIIFPNNFLAKRFHSYLNSLGIQSTYYHSNLKSNESFDFYNNVKNGSEKIIITTSIGLFLNFNNLENIFFTFLGDDNYFANQSQNYNSLEVVEKLAELHNSNLILLDYIDSLTALQKLDKGEWKESKALSQNLKFDYDLEHVDIQEEDSPIFSENLKKEILQNLENGKKTLLVLNRKGYYNFYNCSKCHEPIKCPRCGSILRSIKSGKEVECRVCDFTAKFPDECSNCGNHEFSHFQYGLEKVLEETAQIALNASIVPYFSNYEGNIDEADIIVSTSKILYTPKVENVGLVGLVLPDIDLYFPDFHAPEGAYRFYADVLNRYNDAKVIIQTQNYTNSLLKALENQTDIFWNEQSEYRKLAEVPPYYDIFIFNLMAQGSKLINKEVKDLQKLLRKVDGVTTLKAHIKRGIKGWSQRQFIAKDIKNGQLRKFLSQIIDEGEFERFNSQISFIINPANIL